MPTDASPKCAPQGDDRPPRRAQSGRGPSLLSVCLCVLARPLLPNQRERGAKKKVIKVRTQTQVRRTATARKHVRDLLRHEEPSTLTLLGAGWREAFFGSLPLGSDTRPCSASATNRTCDYTAPSAPHGRLCRNPCQTGDRERKKKGGKGGGIRERCSAWRSRDPRANPPRSRATWLRRPVGLFFKFGSGLQFLFSHFSCHKSETSSKSWLLEAGRSTCARPACRTGAPSLRTRRRRISPAPRLRLERTPFLFYK